MFSLSWEKPRAFFLVVAFCTSAPFISFSVSHGDEKASSQAKDRSDTTLTPQLIDAHTVDRSNFMGARACMDCHRSEYVSWLNTQHYRNTKKDRFDSPVAKAHKEQAGNFDQCYTCHSISPDQGFGRRLIETGTSCESCHGASGSPDGWLNRHAVYGPNVTRLKHESPQHYADRIAICDSSGMVRPGRPYEVAKNCFSCHIIGDPALVGEDVKHPVSFDSFSLIPYMLGEVRHNFHLNQRRNADTPTLETMRHSQSLQQRKRVYFIVEQLAKMEVALNYLVKLPDDDALEEDFADELLGIFEDSAGELEDFVEVLAEPEDEDIEALSEETLAPLQAVIDEFEAFDDLDEPTRAAAASSAKKIAASAAQFLAQHDGSQLSALDEEFLLNEDLGEPVGDVLRGAPRLDDAAPDDTESRDE